MRFCRPDRAPSREASTIRPPRNTANQQDGLSSRQAALLARVEALYREALFAPPSDRDAARTLQVPVSAVHAMLALAEQHGTMVTAGPTLAYHADALAKAREIAIREIEDTGSLTPSRFRDLTGVTRKHAIPLLECLDRAGVTRRTNGSRVLCASPDDAPRASPQCRP